MDGTGLPSLYRVCQIRSPRRTLSRKGHDLTWSSYGPILEAPRPEVSDDDEALANRRPARFRTGGRLFRKRQRQERATSTGSGAACGAGARTTGSTDRDCPRDPGPRAAARACIRASASAAKLRILQRVVRTSSSTGGAG